MAFHWQYYFQFNADHYYLPYFYLSSLLTAIITCLVFLKKSRLPWVFLIYLLVDLIIYLVDVLAAYFFPFTKSENDILIEQTNVIVAFIELSVYFYYFNKLNQSKKLKWFFKSAYVIYCLMTVLYTINLIKIFNFFSILSFSKIIGALEFVFLLFPCIIYFSEIFNSEPREVLQEKPSFWIVIGIFIFSISSIPYYLINYYLTLNHYKYLHEIDSIFFYIPIALNYFFLSRAFLCKKQLTV